MKVVVPMAGRGSRFTRGGQNEPKPLIPVAGQPMLAWALKSLAGVPYSRIVFVVLQEHEDEFGIGGVVQSLAGPYAQIVLLDDVTEGQLCTVMAARHHIDSDEDLLIASCDTYVISNLARDIACRSTECRGIISTVQAPGDQWSFALTDGHGRVVDVAEKVRISDNASTGIYYFNNGREFVRIADEMIRNGEKSRGEYYVIPAYQKYIQRGWRVDISAATAMWDLGTPEAVTSFEEHLASESSR